MKDIRAHFPAICLLFVLLFAFVGAASLWAQTTVSGDVTGTITDPSGAVLPNVSVTIKSLATGATRTITTNTSGFYRFSLLQPGDYQITASPSGFATIQRSVTVFAGQSAAANLQAKVGAATTTVEVTASQPTLQTDNGNISTTMTQELIQNQPNPGNDLSFIAQTAPGAVMNTQSGYGNFSAFGLPATSNLFTSNGMNDNDPFLNLNNSGATNQMLGTNDAREVTVVNNGYAVEYGGLAGSQVNIVSKSGSNEYHGNAQWFYNWDGLNANNWFNNNSGTPKPHAVANQWGASFGGPIKKNKSFFFVNTEGLYLAIPTSTIVDIPSPAFQASILGTVAASQPSEIATYNRIFNLYNSAPGANRATPIANPSTFTCPVASCINEFRSTVGNHTHEWIISGRYDQNLTNADRMFIHFRMDRGLQATYTDPISPVFNIQSSQPQYEGQLNLNHTFGNTAVNQFILAGQYYSAVFRPPNPNAAIAAFPFTLNFSGQAFYGIGGQGVVFSDANQNGRNVTQYQILDDYSKTISKHNVKVGVNFVRNDVTDFRPLQFSVMGFQPAETMSDFEAGNLTLGYTQQFPANGRESAPLALYNLGFYGQDQWNTGHHLTLTIGLRADHYSNPVCQINCFARFPDAFSTISHDPAQPYNQALLFNQHQALNSFDKINWSPRLGFAWNPGGKSVVFRGGVGFFFDRFPATAADALLLNAPFNNGFVVGSTPTAAVPLSAGPATAAAANTAFVSGFNSGATLASLSTQPFFAPPAISSVPGTLHSPQYQQWNLEMQKSLGPAMTFSANYVGNHGIHETWNQAGSNGFDPNGFGGLPLTALDPRFSTVTELFTSAVSNYNGLTLSLTRRLKSLQFGFNYTWSHALDEISNGGILQFNLGDNLSVLTPQDPTNLRRYNYGNADYDTRHYASLNFVYTTPKTKGWLGAVGGWTLGGNFFGRTGYPFTVTDGTASSALFGQNFSSAFGNLVFANQVIPGNFSCGRASAFGPCPIMTAGYTPVASDPVTGAPIQPTFGAQRRNQIYGPSYINTNLTVMKNFKLPHWEKGELGVGAQFFNILNHPNFDQPVGDVASSHFGTIQHTVNTPTSMYGAFLGGDASARQIQLRATLTF